MSDNSDHSGQPRTNIFEYLPEVFRSDENKSVFETSFNRHLTKDDTNHVAGYIGTTTVGALVNRQLQEPTPQRQAYQLQPTMFTQVGDEQSAISFKSYQSQLELMGVNFDRMQVWGNSLQFNWVPPVNIDMLVNYGDYYWYSPDDFQAAPQYITIENRCIKQQSILNAYNNLITTYGSLFSIVGIDLPTNALVVSGKYDTLFIPKFRVFIKNTTDVNLRNRYMTVESSSYDQTTNQTIIVFNLASSSIAIFAATAPTTSIVGRYWVETSTNKTYHWTGSVWSLFTPAPTGDISLEEIQDVVLMTTNCVCTGDYGWDMALWDDNGGDWASLYYSLLAQPTESDWINVNGAPQSLSQWLDTTNDILFQRDQANTQWIAIVLDWTVQIQSHLLGDVLWDQSSTCSTNLQQINQWSSQNKWVHKTQLSSFAGARRAQMPILEYDSRLELNAWTSVTRQWAYRSLPSTTFANVSISPSRLELEPIKGYVIDLPNNRLYLYNTTSQTLRDIDYTSIFVPGFKFAVVDGNFLNQQYTVASSTYREVDFGEPLPAGIMVTVIDVVESISTIPFSGGPLPYPVRIEPTQTSEGDVWRGYSVHWLLRTDADAYAAANTQPVNPLMYRADQVGTPYTTVTTDPLVGTIVVGPYFETYDLDIAASTELTTGTITLDSSLQTSQLFAEVGKDQLRVYVNDIRQYGTYTENGTVATVDYTVVGQAAIVPVSSYQKVSSITFSTQLQQHDVVRIEVGAATPHDFGMTFVPVRTVEDETAFATQVATGTQPAYSDITTYTRQEQTKQLLNQYPLFNVYDIVTGQVISANPIFAYAEDPSAPVNFNIQKRVIISTDGKDFSFEQFLETTNDSRLYAYRLFDDRVTKGTYWYNSVNGMLSVYDGSTWLTDPIIQNSSNRFVQYQPIISGVQPSTAIEGAIWYNPKSHIVYVYNGSTWVANAAVNHVVGTSTTPNELMLETSDPTLTTIWRSAPQYAGNSSLESYTWSSDQSAETLVNNLPGTYAFVPEYVDGQRDPNCVGAPNCDWQIPDQWMYNSEHRNRKVINFSEFITHFRTIIQAQPGDINFVGGGTYSQTQSQYKYWLGGTIKEHNDSYDTLMSAVNVDNVNPLSVIDFARRQYADLLTFIRDTYSRSSAQAFASTDVQSILDQPGFLTEQIVDQYEENEFFAMVYGDSTAFDVSSKQGIRNWVSTAPMFGLAPKVFPHINYDLSVNLCEVVHHDGHRSQITFSTAEQDLLARQIVAIPDPRVIGGTIGVISASIPPATPSAMQSAFSTIRPAVYWYQTGSAPKLYRFNVIAVTASAPPTVFQGNPLPEGSYYFNTTDSILYVIASGVWTPSGPAGNLSLAWQLVDLRLTMANVIVHLEMRLYDVCPDFDQLVFDFNSLQQSGYTVCPAQFIADSTVYDQYAQSQLASYITEFNIVAPYENLNYMLSDPYSWNYKYSLMLTGDPRSAGPLPASVSASWQQLYTDWYGTPYPHLEPWLLQGYAQKPDWWDVTYKDQTGTRRWIYNHATLTGMWENIRLGIVPVGKLLPDGITFATGTPGDVSLTYNYFSVNISDNTIAGGYGSDDLLPPYYKVLSGSLPTSVRSLFTDYNTQIISPDSSYQRGDGNPTEWSWLVSEFHVYDPQIIAFQMQPVRFMHYAWGIDFTRVNNLQVETTFSKVYSHRDTVFHGDIYNVDQTFIARGLNQWYVNFNRFQGYDTNTRFRTQWAAWSPKLSYQFAGIVDTASFDISNKYFEVVPADYDIVLVNDGVIRDVWSDAFEVALISVPPSLLQYNNQAEWKLELSSLATIARTIQYYGVKQYPFTIDQLTGIASTTFTLPWETGQVVYLSSSKQLPSPLVPDQDYYVIRIDDNNFQLAESYNDAITNVPVSFVTAGTGQFLVGEVTASFKVFGGNSTSTQTWYHYAIDRNVILTMTPPVIVNGMQNLINIIDGYSTHQKDQGVEYNLSTTVDNDPDTGRSVSWQLEEERFLNWAYGIRQSRVVISDKFQIALGTPLPTQTLSFVDAMPSWTSGTAVVFTTSGSLPSPLIPNTPYFLISTDTENVFNLSVSQVVTSSSLVQFTTNGSGMLFISMYKQQVSFPTFEINPTRNNVWLDTPQGVVSNIIQGPYADIRVKQTIFDQYGRALTSNNVLVFREDTQTRISVLPQIPNDTVPASQSTSDPYNYIHIGGAHLFVEGYEHVILFNDYTVGNNLVYDEFLGLAAQRFDVDYYEKNDYTLRPTLGGYYLIDGKFDRNIEGQTVDMQSYYDTFTLNENTDIARYSRNLVGYQAGSMPFLDALNVNAKTQFLFYRGMIQQKGSVNSINAYINSRHFVDAQLDEFWAWKIAEFGDMSPKTYPMINLFAADGQQPDLRLEFVTASEVNNSLFTIDQQNGFELVSFADENRWYQLPQQKTLLNNSPLFFDAKVTSQTKIYVGSTSPIATDPVITNLALAATKYVDLWYDTTLNVIKQYNSSSGLWDIIVAHKHAYSAPNDFIVLPEICDAVRVTVQTPTMVGVNDVTQFGNPSLISAGVDRVNSHIVQVDHALLSSDSILTIYAINANDNADTPSTLIDNISQTIVTQPFLWNPARDIQYGLALRNVDLQHAGDPAMYSVSNDPTNDPLQRWGQYQVNKVWLDTSTLVYQPYYDDKVYPKVDDRIFRWGNLAQWASVDVYKWIKTTIAPDQYLAQVAADQSNISIDQNSKTTGTPRTTVFKRTRVQYTATMAIGSNVTTSGSFSDGDIVLFQDTGSLPAELTENDYYFVINTPSPSSTIQLDDGTGTAIVFAATGSANMVTQFADNWITQPLQYQQFDTVIDLTVGSVNTLTVDSAIFSVDDIVDVYVNGIVFVRNVTVGSVYDVDTTGMILAQQDSVHVVRPIHVLTQEETNFLPSPQSDDASVLTQWQQLIEYSSQIVINSDATTTTYYYYWVKDQTTVDVSVNGELSPAQVAQQLEVVPTPYYILQRPDSDPTVTVPPVVISPVFYRQMILRGASDLLNADNRYIIQFTRDLTLRDKLQPNLTTKHEEWVLIRRSMQNNIDRILWNKLVESIVGFSLTDNSRVPSMDRQLYDAANNTDTQYGLQDGQAFVNGSLALGTVLAYLQDPSVSFYPTDINSFFETYSFDTSANIIQAMDVIYNTFGATHVNAIWFNTLQDAFTTKKQYREFLKTSWVALYGVRILEVGNLFD